MRRKLTYELCEKIAKQFDKKVDFEKFDASAYGTSVKNGWINDWFDRTIKPKNYWTYEKCAEYAKQFKYMTQFRDSKYTNVYLKSKKNNWIKDWHWLINDLTEFDKTAKIHLIYIYIFEKTNSFYVGRTMQLKQRDYAHRYKIRKRHGEIYLDAVQKHSKENNIEIPKPIVLECDLTLKESKEKENYWLEFYKNKGIIPLNTAKTGEKYSSIGGGRRKWTYEKVYEEAKKYKHRGDFYKGSTQAYKVALKYGWINDYNWMSPNCTPPGTWTYDKVYNEAIKYKHKIDFEKKSNLAYSAAIRNNYMKYFTWFERPEPSNKLNLSKEYIIQEMNKYPIIKDFYTNKPTIYRYALKYYRDIFNEHYKNRG